MDGDSVQHRETLDRAEASAAAAMPQLDIQSCQSRTFAAVSCHQGEDCHGSWSRCYGLVSGDNGMESNLGRRAGMLSSGQPNNQSPEEGSQEVGDHEAVSNVDHGVGNIRESGVCP